MAGSKVELKGFPAKIDALYEMLAFVREESERAGFRPDYISKIELAAEEALVNIISYAYAGGPEGGGSIELECCSLPEGGIRIQMRDQGIPYNPLDNIGKFNPKNSGDEGIGGYGVFFIVNLMDEVRYARDQNTNILTLIKFIRS